MFRCAVLDDYQHVAARMADWPALAGEVDVTFLHGHVADRAELAQALKDFEIVVLMRERTRFDADLMARLPKLKLIVTTGMHNAAIDLDAAAARGIPVCGTQGAGNPTGELTWALILALARHVPEEVAGFRAGRPWQTSIGVSLGGRTLGVIGLGKIGEQVARIGAAFGMNVIAWSRNLSAERCRAVGVAQAASLEELLARSDVATVHLVLGDRTRGLIGAAELRRMKPSAFLVNTSRAPIVDEAALVRALQERWIAGAALDVFEQEPLPDEHPLRGLDNLVATPHIGYVTEDNYRSHFRMAVEGIAAWRRGTPLRQLNQVDKQVIAGVR